MIKSFLILLFFSTFLYSSQQIILVVAKDFSTPKAKLEMFENGQKVFKTLDVNIGKNGLGWGLGEQKITFNTNEPLKYEGDKKAPAGIFKLSSVFGYAKEKKLKMPYLYTSKNLICVDDTSSKKYNQILDMPISKLKSFENMRRDDAQYELGIVVEHNQQAIQKRGSCIFIHVQKEQDHPTAGCTSMKLQEIEQIVSWLDVNKNPILIQIPKSYAKKIKELYPELIYSELLRVK